MGRLCRWGRWLRYEHEFWERRFLLIPMMRTCSPDPTSHVPELTFACCGFPSVGGSWGDGKNWGGVKFWVRKYFLPRTSSQFFGGRLFFPAPLPSFFGGLLLLTVSVQPLRDGLLRGRCVSDTLLRNFNGQPQLKPG